MIVISDTSPLNYLILIGEENLLRILFGRVIIPQVVFDELNAKGTSVQVRAWAQNLPAWIEVKQTALTADAALDILDAGEREAILLAQELSANLLLVDDKQARQAAANLGIEITGILGILDRAGRQGLINLKTAIGNLQKTNFHIADDLVRKLVEESEARKKFQQALSKVPKVESNEDDRID